MRSLRTARKSSPRLPQLEKARVQQRRPNAAKKKKKKEYGLKNKENIYRSIRRNKEVYDLRRRFTTVLVIDRISRFF